MTVRALDQTTLADFLSQAEVDRMLLGSKEVESVSNLIRLELLYRFGGVWADATTVCAQPLEDWLPEAARSGFFAFAAPGGDRPLSTWFLTAQARHPIIALWRAASRGYWVGRSSRHTYHWVHGLFADLLESDDVFHEAWDSTPKISARHRFHFGPGDAPRLLAQAPADLAAQLANPPAPVLKLTRKGGVDKAGPNSTFEALCRFALEGQI